MSNKKKLSIDDLHRLDDEDAERRERDARLWAVQERLEALGISPDDLIEFLDDWRERSKW